MQLKEFNPAGCTFMGTGEGADLNDLEASLQLHRSQHQQKGEGEGVSMGSGPTGGVSAVFTEFPSNPLLKCPDLHRLLLYLSRIDTSLAAHSFTPLLLINLPILIHTPRLTSLAREFNFLLVVDDTIGNFSNLDLLHSKG